MLRSGRVDGAVLDVLDDQLAQLGAALVEARVEMLRELMPHVRELHQGIAGEPVRVEARYRTVAKGDGLAARAEALRGRLASERAEERRRQRCLVGPQKDEIAFTLGGRTARHFGSRGQVRSLVLSMKLAELVAARARGDRPLFLLDDLSSELDAARTARLVERLVALDTQVWISTTDPDHLGSLPDGEVATLAVSGGAVDGAERVEDPPVTPDAPGP